MKAVCFVSGDLDVHVEDGATQTEGSLTALQIFYLIGSAVCTTGWQVVIGLCNNG